MLVVLLSGVGCKTATITSQREFEPPVSGKPTIVYVANFELGAQTVQHEEGLLSTLPGPAGRIGSRLSGASADPAARAREIVDLMANSLVKELIDSGVSATRLSPGVSAPATGWLVRGLFTEVQEGNRLRRAMIGFGEGQTDLQVIATIDDLSHGPPQALYEVATEAASGRTPGAAPTLVIGPYGAAARFVMAGKDLNRNIKQTAAKLADQVRSRIAQAN